MDISNIRQEYTKNSLNEADMHANPFMQFKLWFKMGQSSNQTMSNAASLATATKEGIPSVRTILLKKVDENGFVFFTNYTSDKAKEIAENPYVALLFFWPELERQIIVKGIAEKTSFKESQAYFLSRPYNSQLSVWVSRQSKVISGREILDNTYHEFKQNLKQKSMPVPDFWGGYRVKANIIEFWQGRENRLHDRLRYKPISDGKWIIERLSP